MLRVKNIKTDEYKHDKAAILFLEEGALFVCIYSGVFMKRRSPGFLDSQTLSSIKKY